MKEDKERNKEETKKSRRGLLQRNIPRRSNQALKSVFYISNGKGLLLKII